MDVVGLQTRLTRTFSIVRPALTTDVEAWCSTRFIQRKYALVVGVRKTIILTGLHLEQPPVKASTLKEVSTN